MRIAKNLIGVWAFISLTGCSLFQEQAYKDYGVGPLTGNEVSAAQKLQEAIAKQFVDATCFNIPVAPDDVLKCQQQRNAAIATLLNASDNMCQAHLKTIFGNDAAFNIISGSIASLASGWGTFINGAVAKSKLSAVAAFSNAERSLVNETVYKNMIVTAVTKKIREARDEKATVIIPAYFAKNISDYPMQTAIRDVISYHYTCSFMFGLERALEEGSQPGLDAKKAKLELEKQKLEHYVDNRTQALTNRMQTLTEAQRTDEINKDQGLSGAKARIKAIEDQLLALAGVAAQDAKQPQKPVPDKPVPDKPVPDKPVPDKPVPDKPAPKPQN